MHDQHNPHDTDRDNHHDGGEDDAGGDAGADNGDDGVVMVLISMMVIIIMMVVVGMVTCDTLSAWSTTSALMIRLPSSSAMGPASLAILSTVGEEWCVPRYIRACVYCQRVRNRDASAGRGEDSDETERKAEKNQDRSIIRYSSLHPPSVFPISTSPHRHVHVLPYVLGSYSIVTSMLFIVLMACYLL